MFLRFFGGLETWNERRDEVERGILFFCFPAFWIPHAGNCGQWFGLPVAARRWIRPLCDNAVAVVARRGPPRTRFGGSTEVPSVGGAGGALRHWERTGSPQALAASAGRYRDGPGRILDQWPAVRPLQRRQCMGGTHFEEDAVRQLRSVLSGVRALGRRTGDPLRVGSPIRQRGYCSTITRRRHVHLVAGCRPTRPRG